MVGTVINQTHWVAIKARQRFRRQIDGIVDVQTTIEAPDATGVATGQPEIVRNDEYRHALIEFSQQIEQGFLPGRINARRRFIKHQQAWSCRQRTGDQRTLHFPTGERIQTPLGEIGKAATKQRLINDSHNCWRDLPGWLPAGRQAGLRHHGAHRHRKVAVESPVLRHITDLTEALPGAAAKQADSPGIRTQQSKNEVQQGGLPGAIRPDQRDKITGVQNGRDLVENQAPVAAETNPFQFKHSAHCKVRAKTSLTRRRLSR